MNQLFVVTESPALLAGMAYPDPATDWTELHRRGFERLVRLHPGDYDPSPLRVDDVELEDLYGGRSPRDPVSERRRLLHAAELAADYVASDQGVVVHCVGGTGRTGTVLVCALRRLGVPVDEAVAAVQAHRPHWPESPWHEGVARGDSV